MVKTSKNQKTLYIHAGGGKTGTSALQNFLAKNKNTLESYGFKYYTKTIVDSDYTITSGNGLSLVNAIKNNKNDVVLKCLLKNYVDGFDKGICSSEYFASLSETEWYKLLNLSKTLSIQVNIVFYVRNVGPFLVSAYDQVIKRHAYSLSFDSFVSSDSWLSAYYFSLINFNKMRGVVSLNVLSYDKLKKNLEESFLKSVGINQKNYTNFNITKKTVNRSLVKEERDLLLYINSVCNDSALSTILSDKFIYSRPEFKSSSIDFSEADKNIIEKKYKLPVEWVNKKFFKGEKIISLFSVDSDESESKINCGKEFKSTEMLALEYFVSQYPLMKETNFNNIFNYLRNSIAISYQYKDDNLLPRDFDPIAYLLINKDVFKNMFCPNEHYIKFGRKEGRKYNLIEIVE